MLCLASRRQCSPVLARAKNLSVGTFAISFEGFYCKTMIKIGRQISRKKVTVKSNTQSCNKIFSFSFEKLQRL
jgi:hypothetical protein